jgi:1-acyl-sn-glycerol-3-phosphate acyltransferase
MGNAPERHRIMTTNLPASAPPPVGFPVVPPLTPQIASPWRRAFGITIMRLTGWRIVGNMPNLPKFVMIVAPHTSNWDFFHGAMAYFALCIETVWLVKDSAIKGPWRSLALHFGAAPIDRSRAANLVQSYIEEFAKRDRMMLMITPEGTRKKVPEWKRGFYHVAIGAQVPIVPVAFDFPHRRIILNAPFYPTGNIDRDLPLIKAHFRADMAKHPDQF